MGVKMATKEIQVDREAVAAEVKGALSGADGYAAMALGRQQGSSDALGAAKHDDVSASIEESLSAWRDMLEKDAESIDQAVEHLFDIDDALAGGWEALAGSYE